MLVKQSYFAKENEAGPVAIPLFTSADKYFEKTASAHLVPEVVKYIEGLRPVDTSQYVLVNALGAGENYGANINGDYFGESGLIHRPDDWAGNPVLDRIKAQTWWYGFPTFYLAHAYAHHRNKDSSKAYGDVELAAWNSHMKRVELVVRVDHDKCCKHGGVGVWDKLKNGGYADVSMGSKVPFDTCSICCDWKKYNEALATFDPKKHAHPGQAILQFHRELKGRNGTGIRGLSITRNDYCEHAAKEMNRILPDGRKVFVHNDYPRFFDISFVFIGADRTAKVMLFIFSGGSQVRVRPSADVAALEEIHSTAGEKTASVEDQLLLSAFGKQAEQKVGEIEKQLPSNLAAKAVPLLTKREPDLPEGLLRVLSKVPLESGLSTLGSLGIVLRPAEFQKTVLLQLGQEGLADKLEQSGTVFPKVEEEESMGLSPNSFLPSLLPLLLPLLAMRSGLGPIIEQRVVILSGLPEKERASGTSLSTELMRKIGAAYNGYRSSLMELVAHSQNILGSNGLDNRELSKLAEAPTESIFTPLAAAYLHSAFVDEVGGSSKQASAGAERGASPQRLRA